MPTELVKDPTYTTWREMKRRCSWPRHPSWKHYGGRGITVCARWRDSFPDFLSDMGPRPAGKSIDRINNDGNYEPGNCRWATIYEQRENDRQSRRITLNGITRNISGWARTLGVDHHTIRYRLSKYAPEVALMIPKLRVERRRLGLLDGRTR